MRFYDDYVGSMDIMQLGQFDSKQDDDARVTYAVRLYEVYPQTIGSYDMTYNSENEQVIVPITLNFRTWSNLTIDQINNATVGKSRVTHLLLKRAKILDCLVVYYHNCLLKLEEQEEMYYKQLEEIYQLVELQVEDYFHFWLI